jgi:hypothetical protein
MATNGDEAVALKYVGPHGLGFQYVQPEYADLNGVWEVGEQRVTTADNAAMVQGANEKWWEVGPVPEGGVGSVGTVPLAAEAPATEGEGEAPAAEAEPEAPATDEADGEPVNAEPTEEAEE